MLNHFFQGYVKVYCLEKLEIEHISGFITPLMIEKKFHLVVSVVLYLEYFKGDIFYLSCVGLWVTGQMREETIFGQMCFLFELFINSQIGKVLDIGGHFGQSLL